MSDHIRMRRATAADAAAIAAVHVACWRETYAGIVPAAVLDGLSVEQRTEQWARQVAVQGAGVFVAERDGRVIGLASAGRNREPCVMHAGEVYALYLRAGYQGRGIGCRLFFAAVAHLQEAGHGSLVVWVLEANPSRRFYESVGGALLEVTKPCRFGEATLTEVAYGWERMPVVKSGESISPDP